MSWLAGTMFHGGKDMAAARAVPRAGRAPRRCRRRTAAHEPPARAASSAGR
jgi:hypothetical protein